MKTASNRPLFDRIERLRVEMREATLAAGVKDKTYDRVFAVEEDTSKSALKRLKKWLEDVYAQEYRAFLEIWRLLPASIWEMYAKMGETTLREQRLLTEARKSLRTRWNSYGKKESAQ